MIPKVFAGDNIFGKVNNPAPIGSNPTADLGNLIAAAIVLVFTFAGIAALIYMMWGAFNWITSGGEKDKLMKAQGRIRNAVVGIFVVIFVFAVFVTLFQFVLGGTIISYTNGQLNFKIPTLKSTTPENCPPGQVSLPGGGCQVL